jgi:AAA family ATP:ADP antiporter
MAGEPEASVPSAAAGSPLVRALRAVAPIAPGETTSALILLVNLFVLLSCYYVLKVVREPLILLGGGAELKAYASAGMALLLLVLVPAFGWLASRVNRLKLLTYVQLFFLLCLVGFYVLARARAPIGLAFYLWLGIFSMMVVSNFWSFANDLYAQDQGKRLFPIVALGGSVGAILGAFLPDWLRAVLNTEELILIGAAGVAVSIVLYRVVDARERKEKDEAGTIALTKPEAVLPVEREGGFTLVTRDRYLRLIAILVSLSTVVNTAGEYVLSRMVERSAEVHASEQMASAPADPAATPEQLEERKDDLKGAYIRHFYSNFFGIVNLVGALLQGLLVARVLQRLGVRGAVLVMPMIVFFGWLGFLFSASLLAIRIAKTVENSFDYSLQNTVKQALYLPTSRASKYKAKAAIDTFFVRLSDALVGIGLVALFVEVLDLGVRAFALMNLAVAAAWLAVAVWTGRLHDVRTAERKARAAQGLRETAV